MRKKKVFPTPGGYLPSSIALETENRGLCDRVYFSPGCPTAASAVKHEHIALVIDCDTADLSENVSVG